MHFHGLAQRPGADLLIQWRVKSRGNEELRQEFLDVYVPRIWELGLRCPTRCCAATRRRAPGSTPNPTGSAARDRRGDGPATQDRLGQRRLAARDAAWVRDSFALGGMMAGGRGVRGLPPREDGQTDRARGSLEAPDDRLATAYARQLFGRRGESRAAWVVPRVAVAVTEGAERRARPLLPPRRRLLDPRPPAAARAAAGVSVASSATRRRRERGHDRAAARSPTTSSCSATASRSGPASPRCSRRMSRVSSIAQDEIGHARALYGLAAELRCRRDADAVAYDRPTSALPPRAPVRAPAR